MTIDDEEFVASTTYQFGDDDLPDAIAVTGVTIAGEPANAAGAASAASPPAVLASTSPVLASASPMLASASPMLASASPMLASTSPMLASAAPPYVPPAAPAPAVPAYVPSAAPAASAPVAAPAPPPPPVSTAADPAALVGQVLAGRFAVERARERVGAYVVYEAQALGRGRPALVVVFDPRAHPCEPQHAALLQRRADALAAAGAPRVTFEPAVVPAGFYALWCSVEAPQLPSAEALAALVHGWSTEPLANASAAPAGLLGRLMGRKG